MYRKIDNQKSQTKLPGYKMIELGLTPESWEQETVNNALTRISFPRSCQILSSEIKSFGKYPVIDQGQSFIAGYSDYSEKVISEHLPVIIFGDHTRAIKYVDFPFIIGADGTKVLKPKPDYEAKFFYYALLFTKIPSRGYNRHFSLLKEKVIPKPPLPEQRKIAAILSTVQKAIEIEKTLIERTKELKKAMMHKLFTEGIPRQARNGARSEKQKITEIGPIPESWEVVRLGEVAVLIRNGVTIEQEKDKIGYKITRIETISNFFIDEERVGYSNNVNKEILNKYLIKNKDILFSHINSDTHIGKTAIAKKDYEDLLHGMNLLLIRLNENVTVPEFINYLFNHFYFIGLFKKICKRAVNQSSINQANLKSIQIPLPTLPEQQAIASILSIIDQKIEHHTTKKQKLEELFRTLLHELMTARVRVDKIEFDNLII